MKERLIDVLDDKGTVLHVFPIAVEDQDGTPKNVDVEQEAVKLATQLVPDIKEVRARPHVSRGGPLTPYADVLETKQQMQERAEQRIRDRAYFLWEHQGCPEGQAEQCWYQACEADRADQ